MRVGVLTFHRCINYGSYWQARCLVEAIAARGHDAVLLDHHSCAVTSREWRYAFPAAHPRAVVPRGCGAIRAQAAQVPRPVSYTHLTLPTTPYV